MSTTKQTKPNANQRAALREQRERQAAAQRRLSRIVRTTWIAGITAIAVLIGVMVWAVAGNRSATPDPRAGRWWRRPTPPTPARCASAPGP